MARADVQATDPGASKVGRATCRNILGLVAFGDATVQEAAREAGITTIHHVDYEAISVLGLFSSFEVTVYGD